MESRERNGRKDKKELKNYVFQFRMNMRKILTIVLKTDFAWPCEKFAQSCEMLKEDENGADELSTLHNCTKLLELMRNCIFSKFLGEEAFEKPLRWCQVSTWLWFINRNLIYSFCGEIYFLIVELFRFFLYRIFYFPSFSY